MPSRIKKVNFFFTSAHPNLRERTRLKNFIQSIFKREKISLDSISFIFASDRDLQKINKKYLNHSYYTDIITFELSEKNDPIHGEVYISIDRVKENARRYKTQPGRELHRVIFHGVLHLCGYGDKSDKEAKEMRQKEEAYLSEYFG